MTQTAASPKSGLRLLKPGEVIFNDGDTADSLFIIQKGQIRLFKPKGRGFIEIGVLRAGEVIGEMAYFDEDGSGKKRSCSAAAITPTEVIEISFTAFGKTMQSLNPWFKTIINTLASRLRKANSRIRELEDSQASISYGGGSAGYEFLKPNDVMKILGTLFLVFKSHGEAKADGLVLNKKALQVYTNDLYQIQEGRLESMINLLTTMKWIEVQEDEEKRPNILVTKNLDLLKSLFVYYSSEKHLAPDKKLRISDRCETLITKLVEIYDPKYLKDIPNLKANEDSPIKFTKYFVLDTALHDLKLVGTTVDPKCLMEGYNVGMFGEVVMENGSVLVECDFSKVQRLFPVIRFMNAVRRLNDEKSS